MAADSYGLGPNSPSLNRVQVAGITQVGPLDSTVPSQVKLGTAQQITDNLSNPIDSVDRPELKWLDNDNNLNDLLDYIAEELGLDSSADYTDIYEEFSKKPGEVQAIINLQDNDFSAGDLSFDFAQGARFIGYMSEEVQKAYEGEAVTTGEPGETIRFGAKHILKAMLGSYGKERKEQKLKKLSKGMPTVRAIMEFFEPRLKEIAGQED